MNSKKLIEFLEEIDGIVFNGLFNRWDDAKGIATETANEISKFSQEHQDLLAQMSKDYLRKLYYVVDHMNYYDLFYYHQLELTFQKACWDWAEELKAHLT